MEWSHRVDEIAGQPRRQFPADARQQRTVVHERSYEEIRELVLRLADQPVGGWVAERLKGMAARPNHK